MAVGSIVETDGEEGDATVVRSRAGEQRPDAGRCTIGADDDIGIDMAAPVEFESVPPTAERFDVAQFVSPLDGSRQHARGKQRPELPTIDLRCCGVVLLRFEGIQQRPMLVTSGLELAFWAGQ